MATTQNILIRNGFIQISAVQSRSRVTCFVSDEELATVLMNLEYYGYNLSASAYHALKFQSPDALSIWWVHTEKELRAITGDDRNIDQFVVYKNFPAEVLNKSEAEYWIPQILMYWGLPNELFTESIKPREDMNPKERKSKTLMLVTEDTLQSILNSLLAAKEAWQDWQLDDAIELSKTEFVDFSKISFKENLVKLATFFIKEGVQINVRTATDVLRLAAGLSDGDVSLRTNVKFKSFDRKTRRFLMNILNECKHIEEDVARRQGAWKKFLHSLHPGEFKKSHARVVKVADDLYNDRLHTFNSKIEVGLSKKDPNVLDLLATRPGEFMRRLVHTLDVFGDVAVKAFIGVIPSLNVQQIVTLRRFLDVSGMRTYRVFPPRGNWSKLQVADARPIDTDHVKALSLALGKALAEKVPHIAVLDSETKRIKLPNGTDEGVYSRGTVFDIPKDTQFIRTASYWRAKTGTHHNVWFDNGWNFFDENWNSQGVISWDQPKYTNGKNVCAVFSGDPTNSKDSEGRAAQVIDLYIDKLLEAGVRYAVWNVLCFSQIPFSEAQEVFAGLQWGEDAQKGNIFEPSRAQLAFQITGEYKTKYVCMIDLRSRQMVYLDANLKANVSSARHNGDTLGKQMPAFLDYIAALPTVYDLFRESVDTEGKGQVLYSSTDAELNPEHPAYIFQHTGKQDYQPMDLNKILGL